MRLHLALGSVLFLMSWPSPASPAVFVQPLVPQAFTAQVVTVTAPHCKPTPYVRLSIGSQPFGFLLPEGVRLETCSQNTLTLATEDYSRCYRIRLLGRLPPGEKELDREALRDTVLAEYAGGAIVGEFGCAAADQHGPAYIVRWLAKGNVERRAVVAFILTKSGVLEFSADSNAENGDGASCEFRHLISSFQGAEADGKLHLTPLSGNS